MPSVLVSSGAKHQPHTFPLFLPRNYYTNVSVACEAERGSCSDDSRGLATAAASLHKQSDNMRGWCEDQPTTR